MMSVMDLEKDSQEIIKAALDDKTKKLEHAKADAQNELNRVIKDFEERFRIEQDQKKADNERIIRAQDNVDEELRQIQEEFELNKQAVVKMLIDQILIVNIDVPKVVQQKYE